MDDHRVITEIIHMLRSGARWRDCPADYGPYTTIYNRFNRWSRQGIWSNIFYALTGSAGRIGTMSVDATHVKARTYQFAEPAFSFADSDIKQSELTD